MQGQSSILGHEGGLLAAGEGAQGALLGKSELLSARA